MVFSIIKRQTWWFILRHRTFSEPNLDKLLGCDVNTSKAGHILQLKAM